MGRGKGSLNRNKEAAAAAAAALNDTGMVGRRSYMEQIHPYPTLPAKRTHAQLQHQNSFHPLSLKLLHTSKRWAKLEQHINGTGTSKRPRTTNNHSTFSLPPPLPSSSLSPNNNLSKDHDITQTGSLILNPQPNNPHSVEPYPHPTSSKNTVINLLYTPLRTIDTNQLFNGHQDLKTLHVRIHVPVEHLTIHNIAVVKRHLWGYKVYTEDSDIVAILLHTGFFAPLIKPPDTYQYVSVLVELNKLNGKNSGMTQFERRVVNGFASRDWPGSAYEGLCTLNVLSVAQVSADCAVIPDSTVRRKEILLRVPRLIPWDIARMANNTTGAAGANSSTGTLGTGTISIPGNGNSNNIHLSTNSNGGIAPLSTTQTTVSNTTQQQQKEQTNKRLVRRSCLVGGLMTFDMMNEPCLVYDLKEVGHIQRADTMLNRLRHEVLYVENNENQRWEFALVDGDGDGTHVRVAKVNRQAIRDMRMASVCGDVVTRLSVPLSSKKVDVLAKRILWTHLEWDRRGVRIVDGQYLTLTKMIFRYRTG